MNYAAKKAVQAATKSNVWLYRRTNGRIGGRGMNGRPLLLLTVAGRRSGAVHTVPVVYFDHRGGYLVVGTGMGGSKRTPQWFRNLQAAVGRESVFGSEIKRLMRMSPVTPSERSCGGRSPARHLVSSSSRYALDVRSRSPC